MGPNTRVLGPYTYVLFYLHKLFLTLIVVMIVIIRQKFVLRDFTLLFLARKPSEYRRKQFK